MLKLLTADLTLLVSSNSPYTEPYLDASYILLLGLNNPLAAILALSVLPKVSLASNPIAKSGLP